MGLAQLALPFRLSTMGIEGGGERIRVSGLEAAFVLHSEKELVIVADVLVIATHNQVIVGCLRCSTLQLHSTWIAGSERRPCERRNVRTTSTSKSVLSTCRAWRCVPYAEQFVVKRHRSGANIV